MIRPPSCPICQKLLTPATSESRRHFPFCSVRCRQIDLFRWAEGKYAIVEPLTPDKLPPEMLDPDDLPDSAVPDDD